MEFDLSKPWCYHFNEIAKIPHGSKNEKAISQYVVDFANAHHLPVSRDEWYNVIVEKPGTPGYEDAPVLVLQAHMDMVCEKNKDTVHDFEKDPLDLYVEDGILHARGTTLGADDGHGVSYMLAILESTDIPHPPLQCFFTTMEEIGLVGALKLKKGCVKGMRMINLDGGGEVHTGLSAAGGADGLITRPIEWVSNDKPTYKVCVRGLSGGHSAGAISREKGNANKLLARVLKEAELNGHELTLVSFDGGLKDNAVPREADAVIVSNAPKEELFKSFLETEKAIQEELQFSDNGFHILYEETQTAPKKIEPVESEEILDYLYLMPNGFRHKSMAIEGLTLTSLNLGVVITKEDEFYIDTLMRSAIDSGVDHLINILNVLAKRLHMNVEIAMRYPGWNYQPVSAMREIYAQTLKEVTGQELQTMAGHGGNECGVFAGLQPGIDIITFGPMAKDIHTPDETLDLASFDRSFYLLTSIIAKCH